MRLINSSDISFDYDLQHAETLNNVFTQGIDNLLIQKDSQPQIRHTVDFTLERANESLIAKLNEPALNYFLSDNTFANILVASAIQPLPLLQQDFIADALTKTYMLEQANFIVDVYGAGSTEFLDCQAKDVQRIEQQVLRGAHNDLSSEYLLGMKILGTRTDPHTMYECELDSLKQNLFSATETFREQSSLEAFTLVSTRVFSAYGTVLANIDAKRSLQKKNLTWKLVSGHTSHQQYDAANRHMHAMLQPSIQDGTHLIAYLTQSKEMLADHLQTAESDTGIPETDIYSLGLSLQEGQEN
jgi:hypothetical protein